MIGGNYQQANWALKIGDPKMGVAFGFPFEKGIKNRQTQVFIASTGVLLVTVREASRISGTGTYGEQTNGKRSCWAFPSKSGLNPH